MPVSHHMCACECVVKRNVSGWCLNINKIQAHKCTRPTLSMQQQGGGAVETHATFIFTHSVIGTHTWADRIKYLALIDRDYGLLIIFG